MVFTPFSWEEKTKMMIASSRGKSYLCKSKVDSRIDYQVVERYLNS